MILEPPAGRAVRSRSRALVLAALVLLAACRGREETPATTRKAPPGRPDVVLVTIDTLRADAVGFMGNRRVETPELDRVAREGAVFEQAHASNVITLPSHTNILTGRYPFEHGVRDNSGFALGKEPPTMATLLHDSGYATGAFIAAFPLDSRFGLDRGFDVYDQRYPPSASPYDFVMQERPGTEVVASALTWFSSQTGKPRFLWVHLYEPHAPYRPPPPFAARFADDPYLGEVSAADAALAPLFGALRRDNALVVVTGDHGEARGGHGELTHGLFAYEETLHVPLLVWSPGRIAPQRTRRLARHVDILPTVLSLAGLAAPKELPGRSLLGPEHEETDYFESLSASFNRGWAPLTGTFDGRYKYIDLPIPELYDLTSDPAETVNLFSQQPEIAARLKRLLPRPGSAAPKQDSETARRLLALGYLSGGAKQKAVYTPDDDPKRLIGVDNQIHRTIDLFQTGKRAEAIALARKIVAEHPAMPTGYEFLAFLLQDAGDDRGAARVLQDAVRRDLASEAMRVRLGLILSGAGQSREALGILEPLAGSGDPDTQNAVGIALADAGRIPEALAVFEKILARDPNNAVTLQNEGITRLKAGDAAGAVALFERALAINDKMPRALNAKGVAEANLNRPVDAIASWKRAAELDPRQYDALFNMGLVAQKIGDAATARQALTRFVQTAPPELYAKDVAEARRILAGLRG
ncbi:MAG TPA: sulfatase-like hydrolase/transferase [Thermoanaerobaculia bacterium]|nr:sulfatase-like hydrolase/transferase [Thermoanaerobaculia bacterium]